MRSGGLLLKAKECGVSKNLWQRSQADTDSWHELFDTQAWTCSGGFQPVQQTGDLCAPEWKDSFDNARHERTLEAVGSMPLFGFPHAPQSTSHWLISLAPSGND
jgi:hypothetical protein